MKNGKLLKSLAEIFLSYLDLDEAYFKILRIIKKLKRKGIKIKLIDIQKVAYKYDQRGGD
jgi:hypothetical protein